MIKILLISLSLFSSSVLAELVTQEIDYQAGDATLKGYLVYDDSIDGKRPGVLVVHEWWGHNAYARKRAEMLAGMGYTAMAVDMYGDGKTAAAMDVLLPHVGEIIGGSQREDRLDVLESRMRHKGVDPEAYSWYLDLRRFGSAPHAGFGLGFERMVQFCTGMPNIRDVIPFPRTPRNAGF